MTDNNITDNKERLDEFTFWLSERESLLGRLSNIERYKLKMKITTKEMCDFYKKHNHKERKKTP